MNYDDLTNAENSGKKQKDVLKSTFLSFCVFLLTLSLIIQVKNDSSQVIQVKGCGDQYGVLIAAVPNLPGNTSNQKGRALMSVMKDKFRALENTI